MFRRLAVVALLVAGLPGRPARVGADPASKDERIAEVQAQLGEASREEANASAQLQALANRRATLDRAVGALDARIAGVQARITAREHEAALLTAAALELDRRAERTARRVRAAKQAFDETAAALYSQGNGAGVAYSSLLFDAGSLAQVESGRMYLERVSDVRHEAFERLQALRRRTVQLRRDAEQRRAQVVEARRVAVQEGETLRPLRVQQAAARDAVAKHEAAAQVVVARVRRKKSQYGAELAALQATSTQIRALLYDLQRGEARGSRFRVARPVPGAITSGFGWRYHPVLGYSRMHTGTDFHAGYGAPIHAAASGRVVWSGVRGGYGNCVVIDHGNQYATLYGHASALYVEVGDHVDAGDTIAAVGASGLATGPHLHFEVRILGSPVDPAQYL